MLLRTREALRTALPPAHALVVAFPGEYMAGGVAPDALRLFAGHDKPSSHFYDDQRQETWERIVPAIRQAYPAVADPNRLEAPGRAWMLGYLTHLSTDVAYWRHVISRLPPFPQEIGLHFGAWVLADQVPLPPGERSVDVSQIRFDAAPPWVGAPAVRQMLDRVIDRILVPDDVWPSEVAYYRSRPEAQGLTDAQNLAERLPEWEANVAAARAVLPPEVWEAFYRDAVESSIRAIAAYLCPEP
jgi:hypothetical protein